MALLQPQPAFELQVYGHEVKVRVSGMKKPSPWVKPRPPRGPIVYLSKSSVRRLDHALRCMEPFTKVLIDLTYPGEFPWDGRLVKSHLNRFLKWLVRQGVEHYLWCLEFQERGAPHFHVIADYFVDMNDVSACWYQIVASGDPRHLQAGTRTAAVRSKGGLLRYFQKYIKKQGQKDVPDQYKSVGRFWGYDHGLCKPHESIRYTSAKAKDVLGSMRPLRKLRERNLASRGRKAPKGEGKQRGFSIKTSDPKGLVKKFLDHQVGNYPVVLVDGGVRDILSLPEKE